MLRALVEKAIKGTQDHPVWNGRDGIIGRQVVDAICRFSIKQNTPGVYNVDNVDVNYYSLALDVKLRTHRFVNPNRDEDAELFALALEHLSLQKLICVTRDGGIWLRRIFENEALPNATNGCLSVGRPRRGETSKAYAMRSRKHRAAFRHADVAANALALRETMRAQALHGEELAKFIRTEPLLKAIDWARKPDQPFQALSDQEPVAAPASLPTDERGQTGMASGRQHAAVAATARATTVVLAEAAAGSLHSNSHKDLSAELRRSQPGVQPPRSVPVRYASTAGSYSKDTSPAPAISALLERFVKPTVTSGPVRAKASKPLDKVAQKIADQLGQVQLQSNQRLK